MNLELSKWAIIISTLAAAISAFSAIIAIFWIPIKQTVINLWYLKFGEPLSIYYYNEARNIIQKNESIVITPQLSIKNRTYNPLIVYGVKIWVEYIQISMEKSLIKEELDSVFNKGQSGVATPVDEIYEDFVKNNETRDNDGKACLITTNGHIKLSKEFNQYTKSINKLVKKKISQGAENKWQINNSDGKEISFPFILKPQEIYILKQIDANSTYGFMWSKKFIEKSEKIMVKIHLQEQNSLYYGNYLHNKYLKKDESSKN
ncbi:hypothetical protein ACFLZV_05430 [Candidatus Margulisiibacteriota bacterium]